MRKIPPVPLVAVVAGLALLPGLGSGSRLSYHEALVAQAAREMVAAGAWLVPTINGAPWLEKPPAAIVSVAALMRWTGRSDELVARLPSALAAIALAMTVAGLASRRWGRLAGLLAGLAQATTAWLVTRGRLADVDLVLAALVAGALASFDALRDEDRARPHRIARLAFFALLGLTGLAKGIGFGAALVIATVAAVLIWDRDFATLRRLCWVPGWALAALLTLAWPLGVLRTHPEALDLWSLHTIGRLDGRATAFVGEAWPGYLLDLVGQTLPWTPLAIVGAVASWRRARGPGGRSGGDRLLWAWAVVPLALVSMSRSRNAHYAIHALAPWSIWAGMRLRRVLARLRSRVGPNQARAVLMAVFVGVASLWSIGLGWLGPRLDTRGAEWDWYRRVASHVDRADPILLLYDDYDRAPYDTPFGPVPHDLAVRMYYLGRTRVGVRLDVPSLEKGPPPQPTWVIARDRDRPALERLGRVVEHGRGPVLRARMSKVDDRAFVLFRLGPFPTDQSN
jgi:4-amino-4-deoxy-L-arabinose transferase-like glycosyltransferase